MYAFIRGIVHTSSPHHCIIDAQGVGYKLFIPASVFGQLPEVGKEVLLHTSFIVRELSQALYGFLTYQERDFFELLIGTSGIGPKLALSIIGHLSLKELQQAFAAGDSELLCKIPGIGKKSAERLIVEMRGKFKDVSIPEGVSVAMSFPKEQQTIDDAIGALIHLGYTQATAQKAIQKGASTLPENFDLATLITSALKSI